MDPQLKSVIGSFGMIVATAIASWAATKGYITPDQQSAVITGLVTIVGAAISAAVLEYKRRAASQDSMIKSVNTKDNGVSVVNAAAARQAGVPVVNGPLK